MSENFLRYDQMVEDALRSVVRTALEHTIENGLSGDHHFYLTFRTQIPGVDMPDFLRERYPEEMTIVIQHQFWDLTVDDDSFGVGMSFDNQLAKLTVPFTALTAFVDPSVKFGLQFNAAGTDDATGDMTEQKTKSNSVPAIRAPSELVQAPESSADNDTDEEAARPTAEVVNLETFRKK